MVRISPSGSIRPAEPEGLQIKLPNSPPCFARAQGHFFCTPPLVLASSPLNPSKRVSTRGTPAERRLEVQVVRRKLRHHLPYTPSPNQSPKQTGVTVLQGGAEGAS